MNKKIFWITMLFIVVPLPEGKESIVLITGFEPFGEYIINPSQLIVEEVNGMKIGNASIIGIVLPVNFSNAIAIVENAIKHYNPKIVISIGLESYAHSIHIEKIGLNLKSEGFRKFSRINASAPLFYTSTIPTSAIIKEIKKAGISARQSIFAGTYVCNAVMYSVLHYIAMNNMSTKAGFIHVPPLISQAKYGMELEEMVGAIIISIETCLKEKGVAMGNSIVNSKYKWS